MELSKQEMELFLSLPVLWSKNFFYKMILIWSKRFNINFQKRKWNYPNRKWNYFSQCQASEPKTSFTKCFLFVPRVSKLIFKTGNGIIQTGKRLISPTSGPLIRKLLLQNVSHLIQRVKLIFITGNVIIQTGNGIIYPISSPQIKKLAEIDEAFELWICLRKNSSVTLPQNF